MEPRQDASCGVEDARLVTETVRLAETSLVDVLRADFRAHAVWSAPGEPSLVGCGAAASVTASGPGELDAVRERVESVFADASASDAPAVARPRVLGGMAFHDGHRESPPWSGFPGVAFVLPHVQFAVAEDATYLTVNEFGPEADAGSARRTMARVRESVEAVDAASVSVDPPGIVAEHPTTTRAAWREAVADATARIAAGDLEKVVLAQALDAELGDSFDLVSAMTRIERGHPECFRFAFRANDGGAFFGPSPERLVSRRGGRVETGALAATVSRGDTAAEDAELERELRSSEKLVYEHEVVEDSIREQLAPVARNVRSGDRRVKKLASVQHLFTPIAADTDRHVLELVDALHPTPAVGGRPPDAALETIREAEAFDRGWYAAPVGWFDADGDGTFAVAIRSALARDRDAHLYAGAGIVADSDADAEWDEIQLKFDSVRAHLS